MRASKLDEMPIVLSLGSDEELGGGFGFSALGLSVVDSVVESVVDCSELDEGLLVLLGDPVST